MGQRTTNGEKVKRSHFSGSSPSQYQVELLTFGRLLRQTSEYAKFAAQANISNVERVQIMIKENNLTIITTQCKR